MTIRLEPALIKAENICARNSRYLGQNVIFYGEKRKITFDTYLRRAYKKTGKEKIMVITKGLEFRPDLVAFDFLGTQNLWWRIMEINKIYDIADFVAGRTIMLPDNVF